MELPRHDGARPAGEVGRFAGGLPTDPALQMVEVARDLRCRRHAGSGVRQRGGRGPGVGARRQAVSADMANWLGLAAAPTFAIMALLTGVGSAPDVLCLVRPASPLSG